MKKKKCVVRLGDIAPKTVQSKPKKNPVSFSVKNTATKSKSHTITTKRAERTIKLNPKYEDYHLTDSDSDEVIDSDDEVDQFDFVETKKEPVTKPKRFGGLTKTKTPQTEQLRQSRKGGELSGSKTVNKCSPSDLKEMRIITIESRSVELREIICKKTFESCNKKLLLPADMNTTKSIETKWKEPQMMKTCPRLKSLKAVKSKNSVKKMGSIQQRLFETSEKEKISENTIEKASPTTSSADLQTSQNSVNKMSNALKTSFKKCQSDSAISKNLLDKRSKTGDELNVAKSSSETTEDKAAPMFTIVDINDIISKRGEYLTLHADADLSPETSEDESSSTSSTKTIVTPPIPERRKSLYANNNSVEADPCKVCKKVSKETISETNPGTSSTKTKISSTQRRRKAFKTTISSRKFRKTSNQTTATNCLKKVVLKTGASTSSSKTNLTSSRNGCRKALNTTIRSKTDDSSHKINITKKSVLETNPNPNTSSSKITVTSSIQGRHRKKYKTVHSDKTLADYHAIPVTSDLNDSVYPTPSVRNALKTISKSSVQKSAPAYIVKSLVTKKMEPIRLMMADFDDSASINDEEKIDVQGTIPTKENSFAVDNCLPEKIDQKIIPEKIKVTRVGNKIIKTTTILDTWFVIKAPEERPPVTPNHQCGVAMIKLANKAAKVKLPSDRWSHKVTLYELPPSAITKLNLPTYTGDLAAQNIPEEDRIKYQPLNVVFRRSVNKELLFDRAVLFQNKTFSVSIEGKTVKLVGAPTTIEDLSEVETLLDVVDYLSLDSDLVEEIVPTK